MPADEFRAKALAWLQEHATPFTAAAADSFAPTLQESKDFQKGLAEAGLAGITWPKEYGGQGLGEDELIAFNEVSADFLLPTGPFVIGLGMPAPTILELGSEEQKKRYIPPMLRGDEIFCQLFSEPNGGSDVASLQTTATRTETGNWLINGQKVWTSGAQFSDFGAILARTDPTVPRHAGITMFIVDMHHPGVTVRPLVVATGDAPFNEVYFDDVEVPADAVIGEVNAGWAAAVVMLRNERVTIGARGRARNNPLGFDTLREVAAEIGNTGDTGVRRKLANVYARETATAAFGRVLHEGALAGEPIGARGSVGKLAGAEFSLWASDAAEEIIGQDIALLTGKAAKVAKTILAAPGSATAGGSNEIQRNIIAERVLGLPKDPGAADRKTPFNQLKLSK